MAHPRDKQRIVILGGGYAGMMAASRAARAGADAEITLIDARPRFVHRIRLHEALAGSPPRALDYAPLLARRGVRFVQGTVESLDPARRLVAGRSADGPFTIEYNELVIALGSYTAARAPGAAEHALRINDPAEIGAAHDRIRALARAAGRVLVVGGGPTGIETVTELAERFPALRITLATAGRIDEGFAARAGAHLRQRFADLGVELRENSVVAAVDPDQARFADGGSMPFDLCVWSAGFVAPPLARAAGLAVDQQGRIVVDALLRSVSHPHIFAVGDAAAPALAGYGVPTGCVSAMPMGAHAGENIRRIVRGDTPAPFAFGLVARCISLGRRDALTQFTDKDGNPRAKIWTGRRAIIAKELIGRLTMAVIDYELRSGLPLYSWFRPARPADDRAGELAREAS